MIIKRFETNTMKIVVHSTGFEIWSRPDDPKNCNDWGDEPSFEWWEPCYDENDNLIIAPWSDL